MILQTQNVIDLIIKTKLIIHLLDTTLQLQVYLMRICSLQLSSNTLHLLIHHYLSFLGNAYFFV